MKESITVQDVCDLLNRALKANHKCIEGLITHWEIAGGIDENEDIVICSDGQGVGMLGLINGMFGRDKNDRGPVCYVVDEKDKIIKFMPTPDQPKLMNY